MIVPQPAGFVARSRSALPAERGLAQAAMQLVPAVRGAAIAAAVGLAAEFVMRALASRALIARAPRVAPSSHTPLPAASRTIITEWVMIERVRRPS